MITTAKISTSFHGDPTTNKFSREFANFQTVVQGNIREVVEFRWDTKNTQTLPYKEYWEYMG